MRIIWKITADDVRAVVNLREKWKSNRLIRERTGQAESDTRRRPSHDRFWQGMVSCLLTSRQKFGQGKPISRITDSEPFILSLDKCERRGDCGQLVEDTLRRTGGIWRYRDIAKECSTNLSRLRDGLWAKVDESLRTLCAASSVGDERRVADFLDDSLAGVGPKQARNILLRLGLARYEIPLDARMVSWLNDNNFAFRVGAESPRGKACYHLIEDAIQALCTAANVIPIVFDGLVFLEQEK